MNSKLLAIFFLLLVVPLASLAQHPPMHHPSLPELPALPKLHITPGIDSPGQVRVGAPPLTKASVETAAVSTLLTDIKDQYEHFGRQVKSYDSAVLALKLSAFLCSLGAALCLVFATAEWSRRTALVLSIFAAAVPAADQVFQVSAMQRISWRTAMDVSRLFVRCKTDFDSASVSSNAGTPTLRPILEIVGACRADLNKVIDAEMEVSLKPLDLSTRIEPK